MEKAKRGKAMSVGPLNTGEPLERTFQLTKYLFWWLCVCL